MRDERTLTVAEADARTDSAILGLLLSRGGERPWSIEELARELGDEVEAIDGVCRCTVPG
jgi:hypothetical protein